MFNSSTKKKGEAEYLFDLTRYYKIWFSKNPDICLGTENELRLIRMRQKNPAATLCLIYSREHLNSSAIVNLKQFCEKHAMTPIAFESIETALVDPRDKALFRIVQDEIRRAINDTGGNLGAAADCARLIVPLIEQLGIYSDCDVHTEISTLDAQFATLRGPMLFPADCMVIDQNKLILTCNTDFLAFSVNAKDPRHLSKDALFCLRQLQDAIIRNYERPFAFENISFGKKPTDLKGYPELPGIIHEFKLKFSEISNIFDFRQFVATLPDTPPLEHQPMSVKEYLIRLSVIPVSGPDTYVNLFKHLLPGKNAILPLYIPYRIEAWQPFLKQYELCRTGFYIPIYDLIFSKNSASAALESEKGEQLSDKAWLAEGAAAAIKRNENFAKAASVIQRSWKHTLWFNRDFFDHALYAKIAKNCTEDSILTPLKERNYALVLRRACSGLQYPVIHELLAYRSKLRPRFNVNEPSSNSLTALDWLMKKQMPGAAFQDAVKTLRAHGAFLAAELLGEAPQNKSA